MLLTFAHNIELRKIWNIFYESTSIIPPHILLHPSKVFYPTISDTPIVLYLWKTNVIIGRLFDI